MIQLSGGFQGINLNPAPTPNSDGSYSVKLSPAQWNTFQENQAKATVKAKDTEPADNEISVSIDSSV